jgi:hypothetical protein
MGNIYILKEVIHPTIKDTHPILSPRKYQIYPKPFSTFASHPCTHSAPASCRQHKPTHPLSHDACKPVTGLWSLVLGLGFRKHTDT